MRRWILAEPKLEEDLFGVRFDGALGDEQAGGDSAVRQSFGDQREDLALACGQLGEWVVAPRTAEEPRDDRLIDHRLAVVHASQRVDEHSDVEDALLEEIADPLGMLLHEP